MLEHQLRAEDHAERLALADRLTNRPAPSSTLGLVARLLEEAAL